MQQLVDRHGRSRLGAVAPVKNHGQCNSYSSWIVSWSIPVVTISSWTTPSFSTRRMPLTLREVTITRRKTESAVFQVAEWTFLMAELVGFTDVSTDNNSLLKSALVQQPTSVAVETGQSFFRLYSPGVLISSCGWILNHGVPVAGYGSDAVTNDWKVRNSWETS